MDQSRIGIYVSSLDSEDPLWLRKLHDRCKEEEVPIIRDDMKMLLKYLMAVHSFDKILEIGTAVGYSSLVIAEYGASCEITTIENYPPRFEEAKNNISESKYSERIRLLFGDAAEVIGALDPKEQFDFVFMDAAKGQYINILPLILSHVKTGSVILTDNCFFDGDIIESRYLVKRRNRTIHKRMREYLYEITHNDRLKSVILPVGDGAAVSTVIK